MAVLTVMLGTPTFTLRTISNPMLQELLTQLARFYRANEASISAEEVSRCQECLPASEISALDRLFSLFLHHAQQNPTAVTPGHSVSSNLENNEPIAAAAGMATKTVATLKSQSYARNPPSARNHRQVPHESRQHLTSVSERGELQQSLSPRETSNNSQGTSSSDIDTNSTNPSPNTEETPLQDGTIFDSTINKPGFSPTMRRLLESCRTDRGKFLREIEEARAVLPTGQGWEAAIATKVENADLRDRMKIYHRFECYNIYQHVVEAGYHTGTHWIREMRTTLAQKLCEEFPRRFRDQKAANKCLNWVDQGCKYHEWAGHFRRGVRDLGYLIALPLDVPHSAYTSRCTKERMHAVTNVLKVLGINELVAELELAKLGDHIAVTLRDLTGRERREAPGKAPQSPCNSPRSMPNVSGISSPRPTMQPGQNPTPPESLITSLDNRGCSSLDMEIDMEYDFIRGSFDQNESAYACRFLAEDWAVPLNLPFENSTSDNPEPPISRNPLEAMDMSNPDYLRLSTPHGYNDTLESLNEWDGNANYAEGLTQF